MHWLLSSTSLSGIHPQCTDSTSWHLPSGLMPHNSLPHNKLLLPSCCHTYTHLQMQWRLLCNPLYCKLLYPVYKFICRSFIAASAMVLYSFLASSVGSELTSISMSSLAAVAVSFAIYELAALITQLTAYCFRLLRLIPKAVLRVPLFSDFISSNCFVRELISTLPDESCSL